ncbi:hypothetical protein [Streptomyces camelliae]|uniref:Uncharacterized protein n=1 Tax=Streptomyces camelliae TaxID=3004093 RepID=A0ABY7P6E5_9ACTN|nr:hypothetical protein [Streptomyces sp. HUAS 2-6]WBO66129.1 hypothetical protein O1G22_26640 [Streptomyces sp. HUAS 2-6]
MTKPTPPPTPPGRTEAGTPPEAAHEHSPDGWEANHAVLAHLAEHRVAHDQTHPAHLAEHRVSWTP